jgi:hypothetical protein
MKYERYTEVALAVDIPAHRLKKGDIATIVDHLPQGENSQPGLALEVFNVLGESIDVIMVAESDVEPLTSNEVSHIRVLTESA